MVTSFININEGVIDGKYDAKLCEARLEIIISNQHSTLMTVQPYTGHTHVTFRARFLRHYLCSYQTVVSVS